jgi:hypothetical protein
MTARARLARPGREVTMTPRFAIVLAAFLTLVLSSSVQAKNRPTVDSPNGDTCFADPTTDKNCGSDDINPGAICYCCYDDGCWICGVNPMPGNECVWDDKYRAELGAPPLDGPMSISPESGHHFTQEALMSLLEKKNVITRKELLEETMRSRKARIQATLEHGKLKESVAMQKRINRYFHTVVVPKLKTCWDRVQGDGTIEIKYLYAVEAKGTWSFKTIQASKSDLPKDQEKAAVACMQQAVTATSFPKEKSEKGTSYLISWVWPVPMPPDAEQQVARMWGSGGGQGNGCDGHGAAARCVTCKGSPLTCVYVCVGSDTCEVQATTPGGFNSICSEGGQCASGGAFGVVGGIVIY